FEEADRIARKNVLFFRRRQERGRINGFNSHTDGFGPIHLVRSEHYALPKARPRHDPEVCRQLVALREPVDRPNRNIHLRVHQQHGDRLLKIRPTCMHEVETEFRMAVERFLDESRVTQAYPECPAARIEGDSGRPRPGVQAYWYVELLSK